MPLFSVDPDGTKVDAWIHEDLLGDDDLDEGEYRHVAEDMLDEVDQKTLSYREKLISLIGTSDSGNWGHAGRPGQIGGSAPGKAHDSGSGGGSRATLGKAASALADGLVPTDTYYSTKFILPDGTRLSGSPKSPPKPTPGVWTPSHLEGTHSQAASDVGTTVYEALTDGVVRYSQGGGAEVASRITEAQANHIYDAALMQRGRDGTMNQPLSVDVVHSGGREITSKEFDIDRDTPETIRAWVNKFFKLSYSEMVAILLGGEGSGNHGHAGRPGEVGGSAPSDGGDDKEKRVKYPRTPHLPWSEGATSDDVHLSPKEMETWKGRHVVITEKMDGENTTMYRDGLHARSLAETSDPTQNRVKALWASIRHQIPPGMRIAGENVSFKHSVGYEDLPSPFLVFSIWQGDTALSWDDTKKWAKKLGLHTVPELWSGEWTGKQPPIKLDRARQEGYVARPSGSFTMDEFASVMGKFVRKGHVQPGSKHWKARPIPNKIIRKELSITSTDRDKLAILLGGDGSGNFGHAGRPGEVGGSAAGGSVPREPGTTPIPAGKIRAYHYTDDIDAVEKDGLDVSKAKGSTYGEPNMIWFSTEKPRDDKDYVEVFLDPEEIGIGRPSMVVKREDGWRQAKTDAERQEALDWYNKGNHNFTSTLTKVPPDRFVTTHRPWHAQFRYMEENADTTGKDVLAGLYDWGLDEPEYAPAILAYKAKYGTKSLGGEGSGNFGHAGRPGEVGGSAPGGSSPGVDPLSDPAVQRVVRTYTEDMDGAELVSNASHRVIAGVAPRPPTQPEGSIGERRVARELAEMEEVRPVVEAVRRAPIATMPLHRGFGVHSYQEDRFLALKPGDDLSLDRLTSFSETPEGAAIFAVTPESIEGGITDRDRMMQPSDAKGFTNFELVIEGPHRSLDISKVSPFGSEGERLTHGMFEVVKIEEHVKVVTDKMMRKRVTVPYRRRITIKQKATY